MRHALHRNFRRQADFGYALHHKMSIWADLTYALQVCPSYNCFRRILGTRCGSLFWVLASGNGLGCIGFTIAKSGSGRFEARVARGVGLHSHGVVDSILE